MKTSILWTIAFGLCATSYSSPNEGPELETRSAEPGLSTPSQYIRDAVTDYHADARDSSSSSYISSLKRLTRGVRKLSARADSCPAIWTAISIDVKTSFAGCNRAAADAIRFSFHDAGSSVSFGKLPVGLWLTRFCSGILFDKRAFCSCQRRRRWLTAPER
jgi:hypothetical protein